MTHCCFFLYAYFLRLGQKENECLLVTIKTDGSGTVIVKPDFNKGKDPYRQGHNMFRDHTWLQCSWMPYHISTYLITNYCLVQDCDRWREEGNLAPHCGKRVHSHETRGGGEGAQHVQGCEFISSHVLWVQSRDENAAFKHSLIFLSVSSCMHDTRST